MMSATATSNAAGDKPRLPRLANTLLVVGLGYALATVTVKALPMPVRADLPPVSASGQGAGAAAIDVPGMGRAIAALHLFGDAAKPKPVVTDKAPAPVQDTRLNLKLAGVFAYEPQELAIAIISSGNGGEQTAYGVGDKIIGEATLKAVYPDHVIINNRGKDEKLSLPENVQPIAMGNVQPLPQAPAGNAQASGGSGPVDLPTSPGALRDTLARNPSLLGRVVSAEPYQENGKLLGYRITPKQNPEILEAQGILAGDVITRVNNIQLNSQKQGIRALRNAVKAQNLEVVVLRDGIEIPVTISLAQ